MSKFTKREYRNIAKRKAERGYGFARNRRTIAATEAPTEAEESVQITLPSVALGVTPVLLIVDDPVKPDVQAILTDLGEQERLMELDGKYIAEEEEYHG